MLVDSASLVKQFQIQILADRCYYLYNLEFFAGWAKLKSVNVAEEG